MTILYALRVKDTGRLLGIEVRSNGNDQFCNSTAVTLYEYEDIIWTTQDRATAERVCQKSWDWHSSSLEYPEHAYVGKIEVIRLSEVIGNLQPLTT